MVTRSGVGVVSSPFLDPSESISPSDASCGGKSGSGALPEGEEGSDVLIGSDSKFGSPFASIQAAVKNSPEMSDLCHYFCL